MILGSNRGEQMSDELFTAVHGVRLYIQFLHGSALAYLLYRGCWRCCVGDGRVLWAPLLLWVAGGCCVQLAARGAGPDVTEEAEA